MTVTNRTIVGALLAGIAAGCSGDIGGGAEPGGPAGSSQSAGAPTAGGAQAGTAGSGVPSGGQAGDGGSTGSSGATGGSGATGQAGASGGQAGASGQGGGGPVSQPDPNQLDQGALFVCDGKPTSSPGRWRRIGRKEWMRNVGRGLGTLPESNPFDPSTSDPFSTFSSDESIDSVTMDLYLNVVDSAGRGWTKVTWGEDTLLERVMEDPQIKCMFNEDKPTKECVTSYVTKFLEHGVYFRPPTSAEVDQLVQFATEVLATEATPEDRPHTLERVTSAGWVTVAALFRPELGEGEKDAAGRRRLGNWELAHELAYAISDRAPGAPPTYHYPDFSTSKEGYLADVASAATDGSIQQATVIDKLMRAHTSGVDKTRNDLFQDWDEDRRGRRGEYWASDKVAGFFREWLGYADIATLFKERPEATSKFDDPEQTSPYRRIVASFENLMSGYYGKEPLLTQQFDDAIARVVAADKDVLATLLTTRQFYVASTTTYQGESIDKATNDTQRVYNIDGDVVPAARWQTLPSQERAGVLTHPAWLIAHGGNFEDDPSIVHRGKWVRQNLLCDYVPPLSAVKVQAKVGPSDPAKSARQRIDEATQSATCQGCHALMNPLGYPFEMYNHAGFVRVTDHGKAPDGSTTLVDLPDPSLNGSYQNAIELSEKMAQSPYVKRCFIRQTFRYFQGRNETTADACTLLAMEKAYDDNQGSFNAMLSALFTSDTFLYRTEESQP